MIRNGNAVRRIGKRGVFGLCVALALGMAACPVALASSPDVEEIDINEESLQTLGELGDIGSVSEIAETEISSNYLNEDLLEADDNISDEDLSGLLDEGVNDEVSASSSESSAPARSQTKVSTKSATRSTEVKMNASRISNTGEATPIVTFAILATLGVGAAFSFAKTRKYR